MSLNILQQRALDFEDQRIKDAFDLMYSFAKDEKISEQDRSLTLFQAIELFDDLAETVGSGDINNLPEEPKAESNYTLFPFFIP